MQIHCLIGVSSYYRDENAEPFQLESLFNDPTLRRAKFVMLHGSWPFAREAAVLILKPNVFVDFSGFGYLTYPVEAARALRLYLALGMALTGMLQDNEITKERALRLTHMVIRENARALYGF